jgi:hypothetical protein
MQFATGNTATSKYPASKKPAPERPRDNYPDAVLLDDGMEHAKIHKELVRAVEALPIHTAEYLRDVVKHCNPPPPDDDLRAAVAAFKHTLLRRRCDAGHARPRPLWEDRKGEDAKLSPPEFIAKHYAAEMKAGTLHRGVIAQHDKALAAKLPSWLRTHKMPKNIDIPTLPEWNTRQLEKLSTLRATLHATPIGREVQRLAQAAKRRAHGLVHAAPS